MSPTGDTPPGRRQGDKSKRLRSSDSAPLPARNQTDIFSVCFQQEPRVNKVLLLFVAHAYCALAVSRSTLHAITPHTPMANEIRGRAGRGRRSPMANGGSVLIIAMATSYSFWEPIHPPLLQLNPPAAAAATLQLLYNVQPSPDSEYATHYCSPSLMH
jgi:hypothetical protein